MNAGDFLSLYEAEVAKGSIEKDIQQSLVVEQFSRIENIINKNSHKNYLSSFLFKSKDALRNNNDNVGLYIYGSVGRGKTMLVDMFFDYITLSSKRRFHYHDFMRELHRQIHKKRQQDLIKNHDIIYNVVHDYLKGVELLVFDEFFVRNIADATILSRVFEVIFHLGIVVITTSNTPPDDIYKDGLNRHYIDSFIALVKQKMSIVCLLGDCDWREHFKNIDKTFFMSCDREQKKLFDRKWEGFLNGRKSYHQILKVNNREISFLYTVDSFLFVEFVDILGASYAADEYIEVAKKFTVVFINNFPIIDTNNKDVIYRLITMIDIFYEHKIELNILGCSCFKTLFPKEIPVEGWVRMYSRLTQMLQFFD